MWIAPPVFVAGSAVIINLWLGGSSPQPTMTENVAGVEENYWHVQKKFRNIFQKKLESRKFFCKEIFGKFFVFRQLKRRLRGVVPGGRAGLFRH